MMARTLPRHVSAPSPWGLVSGLEGFAAALGTRAEVPIILRARGGLTPRGVEAVGEALECGKRLLLAGSLRRSSGVAGDVERLQDAISGVVADGLAEFSGE